MKKEFLEFEENVLNSNFGKAFEVSKQMSLEEIYERLCVIAEKKMKTSLPYNMSAYAYVESVLLKEETPEYHFLAADLMTTQYLPLPNASEVALWHSRQALKLRPDYKQAAGMIVFLYLHEETSATKEEYEKALKMLQN